MRNKRPSKEVIYEHIKSVGGTGIITPDVIQYGLNCYITNADRRLRELQQEGLVVSTTEKNYKRWYSSDAISQGMLF